MIASHRNNNGLTEKRLTVLTTLTGGTKMMFGDENYFPLELRDSRLFSY